MSKRFKALMLLLLALASPALIGATCEGTERIGSGGNQEPAYVTSGKISLPVDVALTIPQTRTGGDTGASGITLYAGTVVRVVGVQCYEEHQCATLIEWSGETWWISGVLKK